MVLIFSLLCTSLIFLPGQTVAGIVIDSSASSWAVPEIQQAYNDGLTYPGVMTDFQQPITREEFCTIVVKLYEKLTGQTVQAGPDPFSDTTNPEIIKAYQLGIVGGIGQGKFAPQSSITRQEICVMIFHCLIKSISTLNQNTDGQFPFDDQGQIAAWALNAMKFAYENQIMSGIGNNLIDPLSETTREQGIALIKRTYEKFKGSGSSNQTGQSSNPITVSSSNATVLIGQVTPPLASQKDCFMKVNLTNRLTNPKYDTRIRLFVANGPGKPSVKPVLSLNQTSLPHLTNLHIGSQAINPLLQPNLSIPSIQLPALPQTPNLLSSGPVYTNADCGAFIDQSGDQQRWFSFILNNASGASNVLWQVSKTPFTGFATNWKQPPGLIASGQVSSQTGEFCINFGTLSSGQQTGSGLFTNLHLLWNGSNSYQEIPKAQRIYYVRAVPVDSAGNCIGDPGDGLAVLYGKPLTVPSTSNTPLASSFDIWSYGYKGTGQAFQVSKPDPTGGEFPECMQPCPQGSYVDTWSTPLWLQFPNVDPAADKIFLQVATKNYDAQANNWESPEGLAYSKSYSPLPLSIAAGYPNAIPLVFQDFAPSKDAIGSNSITYYVRAVALKPAGAGTEQVLFSNTCVINYGPQATVNIMPTQDVTVVSRIPVVKILHYEPVQWEDPDWAAHYVVFRAPQWNEINCKFKNNTTEIYPYSLLTYPNMTPQQYQQQVIPTVLSQGTKVQIVHEDQDKSWWEDLWDSIANFFSDLIDVIKGIVNWVSQAYNGLKQGLIDLVANAIPIPGLKTALTALVDTGLAAMGIPPELPDFDQLTSMSLDYMAETALDESGLPGDQITEDLVEKTASGIGSAMHDAANSATPNPINAAFLKADPDYLERPAYIDVQLSNPYSDVTTVPGSFNIDAKFEYDGSTSQFNSIALNYSDWAQLPTDQQFADALSYESHFWNLLNGQAGYPKYWWIYEPVRGQAIPALKPGETRTVRIYLKEYVGKPYPGTINADSANSEDWANLYWDNWDNATFSVYTSGYEDWSIPDMAKSTWLSQGNTMNPNTIYTFHYDRTSSGGSFQTVPSQACTPP